MKACLYADLFLLAMRDCYALDNRGPRLETASQDSLVQLASRWYSEGEYARTIALDDPADSMSSSPKLHYYRGMSCAALNRYPDAMDCLQNAIRGDSERGRPCSNGIRVFYDGAVRLVHPGI